MSIASPTYKKNIRYYKKLVKSPTDGGTSPSKDDNSSNLLSNAMITQSQALEFEQRLTALERKIGTNKQTEEALEERLSKLKNDLNSKLAKAASEQTTSSVTSLTSKLNSNSAIASANKENWKLIQKLLKELDPGIALTHQQQPLLYKRQQVLACSEELTTDFHELENILNLLLKGTNAFSGTETGSTAILETTSSTSSSAVTKSLMKTPQKTMKSSQDLAQQAKEKAEQKLLQKQEQQHQKNKPNSDPSTQLRLDQVTQAPILTQHYANCEVASEQKKIQDLHLRFQALNDRTNRLQQTLRHYLECYHTTAMAVSEKIVLADERITAKLASP